ncbi:PREDICTED: uncharacterized protein LOC104735667 [Camelina sativa]|uniref:Uncharacterized protein LOC104735666 n=1 Tax=Camelina sativa TaxID=90675 RepID=A0ABM0VBN0_CAMSA|nr:PREDICTED: uncharacterized protein LOC104735666 [Camelina sativa]XP_010453798.1 PREDICTED: uncharacterized protein LOC104735667 [Camelina sativa]
MGSTTRDLSFLVIALFASILFLQISSLPDPSFYDYLRESNLPAGIVPKGVTNFSIDVNTGRFTVALPVPCDAKFENQFHFDNNISGVLSDGRIGNLSGVTQKELFLWFAVKGIHVDPESSGLIHFDVGVADKQLSLSLFESPRDCTAAAEFKPRDFEMQTEDTQSTMQKRSEDIQSIFGLGRNRWTIPS